MKKEIEEMNKAVRCLALELPEQVFLDFFGRWATFRDSLITPSADVQERAKEFNYRELRKAGIDYSIQQNKNTPDLSPYSMKDYIEGGMWVYRNYLAGHAGASDMKGEVDGVKPPNSGELEKLEAVYDDVVQDNDKLKAENERLREYFEKIATSPTPANELELASWRETAIQLCNEALNKQQ